MTQSNQDPNNGNDFDALNNPIRRAFPGVTRITLDGLEVTSTWDEDTPINPVNSPSIINQTLLFDGIAQIDQGTNSYSGVGFNQLITRVLNSNLDNNTDNDENLISITLQANNSLNFPTFGLSPVDSFWSRNSDDINLRPQLKLDFDVQPVPEPLTILGAGTAIAFGAGFKRKLAKVKKK